MLKRPCEGDLVKVIGTVHDGKYGVIRNLSEYKVEYYILVDLSSGEYFFFKEEQLELMNPNLKGFI